MGCVGYNTIQYNTKKFIERYSREIESEALDWIGLDCCAGLGLVQIFSLWRVGVDCVVYGKRLTIQNCKVLVHLPDGSTKEYTECN